jgi:hypothetical protein
MEESKVPVEIQTYSSFLNQWLISYEICLTIVKNVYMYIIQFKQIYYNNIKSDPLNNMKRRKIVFTALLHK